MHRYYFTLFMICVLMAQGCLPETSPPVITGPISGNVAAQRMSKVRSQSGPSYRVPHTHNGIEFEAAWEIGNALNRSAQLQIKPPIDWSMDDVQAGILQALADTNTNPLYPAVNETILSLIGEAAEAKDERAVGVAPEADYGLTVKVKKYSKTWFVEVKAQAVYADGTSIGY
ncbi:MAG TPA: hypothetical protein DEF45_17855 [Rhodopirellula sp.]|nr:MAG: hypothetical protein CBD74_12270 [Saprospirales bacterium TMED214]HBV64877.1 hypothetical protein [Rhodopirellula sp.]